MKKTSAQIQWAKEQNRANKQKLANKFEMLWKELGGPLLKKEERFTPQREFRFDYAIETTVVTYMQVTFNAKIPYSSPLKLAIELNGGSWINGGHNRGSGYQRDCEKTFMAQMLGWKVFPLTADMITAKYLKPLIDLCNGRS